MKKYLLEKCPDKEAFIEFSLKMELIKEIESDAVR